MMPCMSVSKPPLITPQKHDTLSEFSLKPNKSILSFTKTTDHPRFPDSHLNYLCRKGRLTEAVTVLDSIAKQGSKSKVRPNTYINLIDACIDSHSIHLGRKLHACIDLVTEIDVFVETKLVSMYAKCGCFNDARKVFDGMRDRNLYAWSAMIGASSREQRWREVVELYLLMMEDGVLPDDFLFPKILQACGNCGDFETGKLIHCLVIKLGTSCFARVRNSILAVYVKCGKLSWARKFFKRMDERDAVAWNSMISGYCQIGENEEAHRLFDEMCQDGVEPGLVTWNILIRSHHQLGQCDRAMELMRTMESLGISPDVFTWTSMVSGFSQNGRTSQALDLFKEMFVVGVEPNGVTITSAISACTGLEALETGLEIHSVAVKMGFTDDVLVGNSLIDMYSKCGELEAAQQVFDIIKGKDVYSWNSMIGGYCQAGYCGKAYELFWKMQESDVPPNVITWNVMISGYIQNENEDEALELFQRMEKDGNVKQNTASWNSLIAGYQQLGQKNSALGVFRKMQALGVSPNYVTILSVLPACANLVAEKKVKEIHGCVFRRSLEPSLPVMNSLIDTYGNYVLHGCSDAALDLFDQIKISGLKPNRGTFLSVILAYSLAGMVDEGKQLFSSITEGSVSAMTKRLVQYIRIALKLHDLLPLHAGKHCVSARRRIPPKVRGFQKIKDVAAYGPWGGTGGFSFDDGTYTSIRKINLSHDEGIISTKVCYNRDGKAVWGSTHGDSGGLKSDRNFEDSEKKPMSVGPWGGQSGFRWDDGVYSTVRKEPVLHLDDIHFPGDRSCVLPIRDTAQDARQRDCFEYRKIEIRKQNPRYEFRDVEPELKLSFDNIHLPEIHLPPRRVTAQAARQRGCFEYCNPLYGFRDVMPKTEKVPPTVGGVQKIKDVAAYGPWGGTGGFSFDDGTYTSIRQINLSHGEGIKSIKVCYDRDGKAVWGSTHGDSGGFKFDKVIFDYPSEILTCITGTCGVMRYTNVITSITFHTNKGKHGPFGEEKGSSFTSNVKAGKKIVGFHGREGLFLDAIGVHAVDMDIPQLPNQVMLNHLAAQELCKEYKNSTPYFRSMTHLAYH
ncbi:hypothetical protein QYF36_014394 [Acer negundo]|nr:hypothetical protein QYF36_014394 [Acer negundo]